MLLPWLTLFDLRGVASNYIETKKVNRDYRCDDFVILIPIFNDTKYITNIDFLRKYKGRVAFCTTDLETPEFYASLQKIADKHNFQVIKLEFKSGAKSPWQIYSKTLLAHDYVLGESLAFLKSKYVIFLDADTTCRTDISLLVGAVERYDYDISSVKVIPSRIKTITEKLQNIEYEIAMKSRRIYPWLTSGAAMVAKRESMKKIMKKHSLFFNGGDIEIGKIANLMSMKTGHIPVTFETDVPETFPKLVKQRFSWFCGAFRHSVINAHTNFFTPMYAVYFTFLIFLMLPLKLYEIIAHWYIVPFLFLFYITVLFVSNWKIKNRYMFIFPFYSLFQILVLPLCGIYRYGQTVRKTGNYGIMKIHYKQGYNPFRYTINILFIAAIIFMLLNISMVEHWFNLQNINLLEFVYIKVQSENKLYEGIGFYILLSGIFFVIMGYFKTIYLSKRLIKKIRFSYRLKIKHPIKKKSIIVFEESKTMAEIVNLRDNKLMRIVKENYL